jgi:3-methyladenine DNA glycosylase/8-oxoguanine DNA glycosylase
MTLPFDWDAARDRIAAADRKLAKVIARAHAKRLVLDPTESSFEALAESIVYQQLTGKAAATIYGRVRGACGRRFTPRTLLARSDQELRGAGLSGGKTAALRDLAAKCIDGTVPSMDEIRALEDEAIVERLTAVRGVGRWTVEMLLIFRLGRPDVLPVADYGVRKGFARAFGGELPTPRELEKRGEKWRPFRTVASWFLRRALDRE